MLKIQTLWISVVCCVTAMVGPTKADIIHSFAAEDYAAHVSYGNLVPGAGWIKRTGPDGISYGSGTKVGPNAFLFSAHGAAGTGVTVNPQYSFDFGFGGNYNSAPGQIYTASKVVIHPSYNGFGGPGFDIALLFVPEEIQNVPTASLYDGIVVRGDDLHTAAYGNKGTVAIGEIPSNGDRLGSINRVSSRDVTRDNFVILAFEAPGNNNFRELGSQYALGDSGSGGFLKNGSDYYLGGVLSGGTPIGYGAPSSFSRIDLNWIATEISNNPVTAVPEPTVLLLLAAVLSVTILSRKRDRFIVWFCSASP